MTSPREPMNHFAFLLTYGPAPYAIASALVIVAAFYFVVGAFVIEATLVATAIIVLTLLRLNSQSKALSNVVIPALLSDQWEYFHIEKVVHGGNSSRKGVATNSDGKTIYVPFSAMHAEFAQSMPVIVFTPNGGTPFYLRSSHLKLLPEGERKKLLAELISDNFNRYAL